jgi:hypothetical protein
MDAEKNILKPGTVVRLVPNLEEGWDEEYGTVVSYEGVDLYIVRVDKRYWDPSGDDGLREILGCYLEEV